MLVSPSSIISTDEIHKYHPFIKLDGILGAFYTPEDGYTDPTSTTNAMAKGARDSGAKIYRKNRVTNIEQLNSGEWKVITEKGDIICEHVVNAAGKFFVRRLRKWWDLKMFQVLIWFINI